MRRSVNMQITFYFKTAVRMSFQTSEMPCQIWRFEKLRGMKNMSTLHTPTIHIDHCLIELQCNHDWDSIQPSSILWNGMLMSMKYGFLWKGHETGPENL